MFDERSTCYKVTFFFSMSKLLSADLGIDTLDGNAKTLAEVVERERNGADAGAEVERKRRLGTPL